MHPLRIHLDKVSVAFEDDSGNKTTVLKEVDLMAKQGECIAIMGPSGSGKSTLLKVIANLINRKSPKVDFAGAVVVSGPVGNLGYPKIGYMAQESKDVVVPWKKVVRVLPDRELLDALELQDHAEKWPATLSGGQLRRLALGYVLSSDRDIFLLDEPLTGMDIDIREKMRQLIDNKVEKKKDILLFITHYLEEAEFLAKRFFYIEKGACIERSIEELRKIVGPNNR
jgi:ABC-type multidrug transport system ATPase subunit